MMVSEYLQSKNMQQQQTLGHPIHEEVSLESLQVLLGKSLVKGEHAHTCMHVCAKGHQAIFF